MTAPGTAREEHQAMEFSVTKSALLNELSTTQGVVERKTTIPILSNLLIVASGSHLTITATDLELSIRTSCEAKIKKEGAGTIPAKKLLELVRLLPEGEIKVKLLDNHWVEIVSDRKKYKLVGMAKENFPALPVMPHTLVKIPAAIIENLIAKTKFAISMEESRYTLNGGLLILKPDTLAMVATDGHRLALAETDQKLTGLNGEMKVLIPKKAMDEVEKLAAAAGSDAQIEFAHSHRAISELRSSASAGEQQDGGDRTGGTHRRGAPRLAARGSALARCETCGFQGRHRDFRIEPGVRRSERKHRQGIQGRSHRHRFQLYLHAGFSFGGGGWAGEHRAEGRTIRRRDAAASRRKLPLPLHHHAHAHLIGWRFGLKAMNVLRFCPW